MFVFGRAEALEAQAKVGAVAAFVSGLIGIVVDARLALAMHRCAVAMPFLVASARDLDKPVRMMSTVVLVAIQLGRIQTLAAQVEIGALCALVARHAHVQIESAQVARQAMFEQRVAVALPPLVATKQLESVRMIL